MYLTHIAEFLVREKATKENLATTDMPKKKNHIKNLTSFNDKDDLVQCIMKNEGEHPPYPLLCLRHTESSSCS